MTIHNSAFFKSLIKTGSTWLENIPIYLNAA